MPSKDELNKLYINKNAIGGSTTGYYWSSTEYDNNFAWGQVFSGYQTYFNKSSAYYVRAVRAF